MKPPKSTDVDTYIANAGAEARATLVELRRVITSTIPKAEERISYGVPFYIYHGQLVGFAAYKGHASFGFGAAVLQTKDRALLEQRGYTLGKVTMQIRYEQDVPVTAIRRILKAKAKMNEASKAKSRSGSSDAAAKITRRIQELGDWRGEVLAHVRQLIQEADPEIQEEWKWGGTPVWAHDGIVCTGETYKHVVKLTFARGASLRDPRRLFNAGLGGNTRRAIDIGEGEAVHAAAFKALIRSAVAQNKETLAARAARKK